MTPIWPHGDPRAVARAIVADKHYHLGDVKPEPKSLWDIIFDYLSKLWNTLMRPLSHMGGNDLVTKIVGFGVLALVLIFMAVVIVRFTRASLRSRVRAQRLAAEALAAGGDARALLDRALAAAAAGRYREAAALLWASALRGLDERGRVRFDAARTPGEWRRAVRDPNFDRLARDAVVALFGDRGVDATLFSRMQSSYDAMLRT